MKRILNYVGSKWNLAEWIVSHMPEHSVYLEPFFGSEAVLFNKAPVAIETVNDVDGNIVNLFKVIRDRPQELARAVALTPYARQEYCQAYEKLNVQLDELERARLFLVRCWMGRGGKTSDRTGWRHNIDATTINAVPDWLEVRNTITQATQRLQRVQIENQDALPLIERYNRKDCLIYADPPYLLSTRTKRHYANEMSESKHIELLQVLKKHQGYVLLSGYDSAMYNELLSDWHKVSKMTTTDAANLKQEVLWINPKAANQCKQLDLFSLDAITK